MPAVKNTFYFFEEIPIGSLRYMKAIIAVLLYEGGRISKQEAMQFSGMEETEFNAGLKQIPGKHLGQITKTGEEAFDDLTNQTP